MEVAGMYGRIGAVVSVVVLALNIGGLAKISTECAYLAQVLALSASAKKAYLEQTTGGN